MAPSNPDQPAAGAQQQGQAGQRGGRSNRGTRSNNRSGRGGGRGGRHVRGRGRSRAPSPFQTTPQNEQQPAAGADASGSRPHDETGETAVVPPPGRGRGRNRGRNGRSVRGSREGVSANEPRGGLSAGGRHFGARLTAPLFNLDATSPEFVPRQPPAEAAQPSTELHLRSRIEQDIKNNLYECSICTNAVTVHDKIWHCTVCWMVLHWECVGLWHTAQVAKHEQEPNQQPHAWTCPGCRTLRTENPGPATCWCGKGEGSGASYGRPHSCSAPCLRPRGTCLHKCTEPCHAGPCPPCEVLSMPVDCHCGKNTKITRCATYDTLTGWSCDISCGDLQPCGVHTCPQVCHRGICDKCVVPVEERCYCGKTERQVECHERGELKPSFFGAGPDGGDGERPVGWSDGGFKCGNKCQRRFDCSHHQCSRGCHPQDEHPAHCPLSPDVVVRCHCGKALLADLDDAPRQACTDPVPSCTQTCDKALPCGHRCADRCHSGECSPCPKSTNISCGCGRPFGERLCKDLDSEPPICDRTCQAKMSCGCHMCPRKCCPGAKKATARLAENRANKSHPTAVEDFEAEHVCVRICGKKLTCGSHTCPRVCHKGSCSRCLEATFEDLRCPCGRTVAYAPVPCGITTPACSYACDRPPPCGHPKVYHPCHPDDVACLRCPFLTEKECVCGKKKLRNQQCGQQNVRCGLPCGKTLKCGLHKCQETCHNPGECEDAEIEGSHCTQPCGKSRSICGHACVDQCHGPTACKEDKRCQAKTFATCPCRTRKQEVKCGASTTHPHSRGGETLLCDDECLRLQRNQRLAAALGVDQAAHTTDDHVPYSDETLSFYRENAAFCEASERDFRIFAAQESERRLRFKPMPSPKRMFLHLLAADYGLDSESQDPAPQRHVCIWKSSRFVAAPTKTIRQCLKIRAAQQAAAAQTKPAAAEPAPVARSSSPEPGPASPIDEEPYNALLISGLRFGVTVNEVEAALSPQITTVSGVDFHTTYLPSDEIVMRAVPSPTASSSPESSDSPPAPTSAEIATALARIRTAATTAINDAGLATSITLCRADDAMNITRPANGAIVGREWSAVVGRAVPSSKEGNEADQRGGRGRATVLKKMVPWRRAERGGNMFEQLAREECVTEE